MEPCIEHATEEVLSTIAHDFQPRYHEISDVNHKAIEGWSQEDEDIAEHLPRLVNSKKIYVGDICVFCGLKVMVESATPEAPKAPKAPQVARPKP
jgi:hypothetical protein